jgi:hypothetical protein
MIEPLRSSEKVLVTYYSKELKQFVTELWWKTQLWEYMARALKYGEDPLDLMHVPQNEYALGRAEVYGMQEERRKKYGR